MSRRATQQAAQSHKSREGASLEQQAAQAKAERGKKCADELQAAITAISAKWNCEAVLVVQIGSELSPLTQVLSLPVSLTAIPLDIAPAKVEPPSTNGVHKD